MTKKRILVISDIHGCYEEFCNLLEKVRYDSSQDQLILLGDYVDRGEKSRQVIDKVMELVLSGAVALRGNHDNYLLSLVYSKNDRDFQTFSRMGGFATLRSYSSEQSDNIEKNIENIKNNYSHHLLFINSLPYSYETDNHIFVHAGINPSVDLDKQDELDFTWIRDDFIKHKTNIEKKVVFGHTTCKMLHNIDGIYFAEDKIGIDGGCCFGKQLNCLEISENGYKEYSVKSISNPNMDQLTDFIISRGLTKGKEFSEEINEILVPLLIQKLSLEEAKFNDKGLIGYHSTFIPKAFSILKQNKFKTSEMQPEIQLQIRTCEDFLVKMDYYMGEAEKYNSLGEHDLEDACSFQVSYYGRLFDLMKKSIDLSHKLFFHEDIRQTYHNKYLRTTRKGDSVIFVCDLNDFKVKHKKFFFQYGADNSVKGMFYLDQYSDEGLWDYVKQEKMITSDWENELVIGHDIPTTRIKRIYIIKEYKIDTVIVRNNDESFSYRIN